MGTANKFTMASSGGVWFLSKIYVRLKKSKKLKSKFLKSDDFKYVFIFPSITLLWDSGLLLQLRKITQRLWIVKYKLAMSLRIFAFFTISEFKKNVKKPKLNFRFSGNFLFNENWTSYYHIRLL